ncbi:hypothetical protein OG216_36805 [Streptomycetaceae bacterium NBC_01309]
MPYMTRTDVLQDLASNGRDYSSERLHELAVELDLLVSDVFVVAGRTPPRHLLPPARDPKVLRDFTYRVTYCEHDSLAPLEEFVSALASAAPAPTAAQPVEIEDAPPDAKGFAAILAGLMRNRGFGIYQLPFTGLSLATIRVMLARDSHLREQVESMAGPLGWTFDDLAALANTPQGPVNNHPGLCRHVGQVYVAAIPLTTDQLVVAAREADRLSGRVDHGMWRPVTLHDAKDRCRA